MLGLEGEAPETTDPRGADPRLAEVRAAGRLRLDGSHEITFDLDSDVVLHRRARLAFHSNGMRFTAWASAAPTEGEEPLHQREYYSVGGGFVLDQDEVGENVIVPDDTPVKYPFTTGDELLARCAGDRPADQRRDDGQRAVVAHRGRGARGPAAPVAGDAGVHRATGAAPRACCPAGSRCRGAPRGWPRQLRGEHPGDPLAAMDWVTLYALAVNEENASGGRIVTAPTNGAAGIIPAVLHYYTRFVPGADDDGVVRFLLTAAAIGSLYKENASISGAEVGCQGEVGSACSMAAGALAEVLGGTPDQVENAAEIGIEHNLGLTCDPVGGLVQIPCIERNAVASVKAITAARIALRGNGKQVVSLDKAIKTMRDTGARHDGEVQGDRPRRPRRQRHRVLSPASRRHVVEHRVQRLGERPHGGRRGQEGAEQPHAGAAARVDRRLVPAPVGIAEPHRAVAAADEQHRSPGVDEHARTAGRAPDATGRGARCRRRR